MKTLVIPVEDGVDEALQTASARRGRNKAELVSDAIRAYLETEGAPATTTGSGPRRHISKAQACRMATSAIEKAEARRKAYSEEGARSAAVWEMGDDL